MPEAVHCEADEFFIKDGVYNFDATKLPDVHMLCRQKFMGALDAGKDVIVSNTQTSEWEMVFYKSAAEDEGYQLFSLIVENCHGGESTHGAPEATVTRMRERFHVNL